MKWLSPTLLAQSDRFSDLGGRFQDAGNDPTGSHLLLGGVVILAAVGVYVVARYLGFLDRGGRRNQRRLFRELCKLHGLDWPSRKLLLRVAVVQQVETPAQLFLQPEKFNTQPAAPALEPFTHQIEKLRARLFESN